MDKNTKKEKLNLENVITLKNLKRTIIICFILSIVFEFLPSIFNIYEIFNYASVIAFLQPHKDFFTNITLGCLGSAVISYIMLLIPQKIKIQSEEKEMSAHLICVIKNFNIIYFLLQKAGTTEDLEYLKSLEHELRIKNNDLKVSINKMMSYCEKISFESEIVKKIRKICEEQLFKVIDEIDIFLQIYTQLKDVGGYIDYPINVYKDIYGVLNQSLEEKYKLKKIENDFNNIAPIGIAVIEDIKKITESMIEYFNTVEKAECNKYYIWEIGNIFQKYSDEIILEGVQRFKEKYGKEN